VAKDHNKSLAAAGYKISFARQKAQPDTTAGPKCQQKMKNP